jgi:hypothetical protein
LLASWCLHGSEALRDSLQACFFTMVSLVCFFLFTFPRWPHLHIETYSLFKGQSLHSFYFLLVCNRVCVCGGGGGIMSDSAANHQVSATLVYTRLPDKTEQIVRLHGSNRLCALSHAAQGLELQQGQQHRQRGLCRTDGAHSTVRRGAVGQVDFFACLLVFAWI